MREPAAGWTVVGRRGIHATNRAMAAAKRDYYDVLGVERGCEEKEIKAAYGPRTLSCWSCGSARPWPSHSST